MTRDSHGILTISSGSSTLVLGSLTGEDQITKAASIARLFDGLERLAAVPKTRVPDGTSLATLEIAAPSSTLWREVAWIAQVASARQVVKLQFRLEESPKDSIAHELPKDEGIDVPPDPEKTIDALRLRFSWVRDPTNPGAGRVALQAAVVKERIYHDAQDGDVSEESDEIRWEEIGSTYDSIRQHIAKSHARKKQLTGLVEVAPSAEYRGVITYGDVFAVLRAFRDEGVASVKLWGVFPPLPKTRGGHGP